MFKTKILIFTLLIVVLITNTMCVNKSTKNNSDILNHQSIKGWNILSDNYENAKSVIEKAEDYQINHLQLSHHLIHDLMEIKNPEKRKTCNELITYAHAKGIDEVLVWDHALYSLSYYPDKFKSGPNGTINLDNQEFWEWLKNDYREMLNLIPAIDGIILTFIETGARVEDQHSDILKTPAEKLAKVIDEIASVIIDERHLKLYARTFIYTHEELSNLLTCIDNIENENIILMVKEVPHDFFLTHPVQSYIDELDKPVLIEFDAAHEYSGQGIIANTFVEKTAERWRFYQNKKNVIGYVARIDRYGTTKIIDRPSEILLYTLNELSNNPSISDENIYDNFITSKYGKESLKHIKPAFKKSHDIITSSLYTLGLCMANHSTLSCHYQSVYNRYVSGRWMNDPIIEIKHNVDTTLHYYKDIVNHLAPKHIKEKNARLFKEDPFLLEKNWIIAEELLNKSYFDLIVKEKNFGVKLAEEALNNIIESEPFVTESQYDDLYATYYRTLIKAKISRAASKSYFSYRLWCKSDDNQTPEILNNFWEGIDEMNDMAKIIEEKFHDSPSGGWSWEEDLATVKKYEKLMTIEGWDDYNGEPIVNRDFEKIAYK